MTFSRWGERCTHRPFTQVSAHERCDIKPQTRNPGKRKRPFRQSSNPWEVCWYSIRREKGPRFSRSWRRETRICLPCLPIWSHLPCPTNLSRKVEITTSKKAFTSSRPSTCGSGVIAAATVAGIARMAFARFQKPVKEKHGGGVVFPCVLWAPHHKLAFTVAPWSQRGVAQETALFLDVVQTRTL